MENEASEIYLSRLRQTSAWNNASSICEPTFLFQQPPWFSRGCAMLKGANFNLLACHSS